jgi:hypothetical protein
MVRLPRRGKTAEHQPADRARGLHGAGRTMTVQESSLRPLRDFLLREFRGYHHVEYFDIDEAAQIFVMESEHGRRHTLVVPVETFADVRFMQFCTAELAAAMRLADGKRLTLTLNGVLFQ